MTYRISIANEDDPQIGLLACDADSIDVVFYCPGANGVPDFTSPVSIATGLNLPAGSPPAQIGGPQTCVINVNPGVFDAVAEVRAGDQTDPLDNLLEGGLHDAVVNHPFRMDKQLGTDVVMSGRHRRARRRRPSTHRPTAARRPPNRRSSGRHTVSSWTS